MGVIAEAIFAWARTSPDAIAVEQDGEPWSYRVFADAIASARGHFRGRGLEGEGYVAVALANLRDSWVASLALRSLGLTVVPVGSAAVIAGLGLPHIRAVVFGGKENWPGLAEACAVQGLDLVGSASADAAPLRLDETAHPTGGHVLLTSGTTGRTKKVLFEAFVEAAFLRRRLAVFPTGQETVANLFHFGAWTGIGHRVPAAIWLTGGTVAFNQRPPWHLAFRRPGLSSSPVSPPMLADILAAPEGAFPRSETMDLRIGGGTVTQSQIDQAKARITPRVFNGLACTESHHIAMTRQETPDDHRWHRLEPTTIVELVDEFDRPTPMGQTGRLRIGTEDGPGGYLHDDEATRTFFKDGFFYPGDLAVMRADGRIALQGRVTDVINVKGEKLWPAPIEDRLREVLGLSGACLLSMQNEAGEEELHLLLEAPRPLPPEHVAPALRRELQGSGIETVRVTYLASLPRNATGKVLRQAATAEIIAARGRG